MKFNIPRDWSDTSLLDEDEVEVGIDSNFGIVSTGVPKLKYCFLEASRCSFDDLANSRNVGGDLFRILGVLEKGKDPLVHRKSVGLGENGVLRYDGRLLARVPKLNVRVYWKILLQFPFISLI